MAIIKNFEDFSKHISGFDVNESDGFGTSPFLLKKIQDIYHYFFNIDKESGAGQIGYHVVMGKYSNLEVIEGPKNSYCVVTINQVSPEIIEDIAVDKKEIPSPSNEKFELSGNEVSRLMESLSKCLLNYLEMNPKISRIYDEMQENLDFKGDGNYMEFMKSIIISYLGDNWKIQEGVSKKSLIISR